jgi:hypothetical protein
MIDPAVAIAGMCVEGAVVMWLLPSRHLDSPKEEAKKAVLFFWRDIRLSTRSAILRVGRVVAIG